MSWGTFDNSMQNEGGFMDTTATEGAGDEKGLKRGQNCIPVMIAHLNRFSDKLAVWGIPAKIVTFVAVVRKLEFTSTKVSFEFQDETGAIKGVKWLEGEQTVFESPVQVNSYARVYGLIREQNSESFVMITSVQPLDHLNELLTHLMEVTVMSLQGERMSSEKGLVKVAIANQTMNGSHNGNNVNGMSNLHQQVLEIIQNSDPEYGAERSEIKSRVPQHLVGKVDEIIEFLSAEGHIYTTKTDDFFKAI